MFGEDPEEMRDNMRQLRTQATDKLADIAEKFQGDTYTDELARSIIGSMRPLVEGAASIGEYQEEADPAMFMLFIQQFLAGMRSMQELYNLAEKR